MRGKKKNHSEKKRNLRIALPLLFLSLMIAFMAVFCYGKIDESDLHRIETTVVNVEGHHNSRKVWITFSSPNGQNFYCRTDTLDLEHPEVLTKLMNGDYDGKSIVIYYTERIELLPADIISYWGQERVVALECNGQSLIGSEDYNRANLGSFIGFIAIALIGVLIALLFFLDLRPLFLFTHSHKQKNRR